jgi:hypothetical protein
MTLLTKIDSNGTGLRVCEEASLGVLPAVFDQVWFPAEPNTYNNFGGQFKKVARRPINASRQNRKGVTVDLDAAGGYNTDLTQTNLIRQLQGFLFADAREPYDSQSMNGDNDLITVAVASDDTYHFNVGDDLNRVLAQSLVFATDFSTAANNGLNLVNSVTRAKATGTLTLTPGSIDAADDVELGGVYYAFAADPTTGTPNGTIGSPFLVALGANDTAAFANLRKAINATGSGGVDYSIEITSENPFAEATASNATTMSVSARHYGYAGNFITTTIPDASELTWGGGLLTGGTALIGVNTSLTDETVADPHAVGTLTLTPGAIADDVVEIDGIFYQFAADPTTGTPDGSEALPFLVDVGGTDTISLANLRKAINNTGIPGTTYAQEISTLYPNGNPRVVATASGATTLNVRARNAGVAGNEITTSVTLVSTDDGLAWGSSVLSGGAEVAARVRVVGYEFASSTVDVSVSFTHPRIVRASGAVDFTTFGLVPGQFLWVGGDSSGLKFVNENMNGWARIRAVNASYIEFDKTSGTWAAETGTSLTVQIFFGVVVKNEPDPTLIKRRTYHLERSLGAPDDSDLTAIQSEVLTGAVSSEMVLDFKTADKVTVDLSYMATDDLQRTSSDGLLSQVPGADAPSVVQEDAFNTSNDFSRLKMVILDPINSNPTALFAFLQDFKITVNNSLKPNKAISVLGAFEVTAGQFVVTGTSTAYFSEVQAIAAVRNNSDVSIDFALARDNRGFVVDIPLISLGDGRADVKQDEAIMLGLSLDAAADRVFDHTILFEFFPYLPSAAE